MPKKIIYLLTIAIVITFNIISIIFFIIQKPSTETFYRPLSSIDQVLDTTKSKLKTDDLENFWVNKADKYNQSLGNLGPFAKETLLSFDTLEDASVSLNNNTNTKTGFDLNQKIDDKTALKLIYNQDQLDFALPEMNIKISQDGKNTEGKIAKPIIIFSIKDLKKDQLIKLGDSINLNLETYTNNQQISIQDLKKIPKIEIYTQSPTNLLSQNNPSFDQGLWRDNVSNCSEGSPGEAVISQELATRSDNPNDNYLKLSSKNHFACTNLRTELRLDPSKYYNFGFDYQSPISSKINYYWSIENSNQLAIERQDPNLPKTALQSKTDTIEGKPDWQKYNSTVRPSILDNNFFTAYLYANSTGQEAISHYDNLFLKEYIYDKQVDIAVPSLEEFKEPLNLALQGGSNQVSFFDTQDNILPSPQNPSFDQGLWTPKVINCSRDNTGSPAIQMDIVTEENRGSVLRLKSDNHFACTGKKFDFELDNTINYKLSFDYKNTSGKLIRFYYKFLIDKDIESKLTKSEKAQISRTGNIEVESGKWLQYSETIKLPNYDVKGLEVYFYAPSSEGNTIENFYDNLSLSKLSPANLDNTYLQNNQDPQFKTPIIEYQAQNLLQNQLNISNATDPFLFYKNGLFDPNLTLQFSQNPITKNLANSEFNPQIPNSNVIELLHSKILSVPQYKLNQNLNLWYVDIPSLCKQDNQQNQCTQNPDGSYNLSLAIINNNQLNYIKINILLIALSLLLGLLVTIFYKKTHSKTLPKLTQVAVTYTFDQLLANNRAKAMKQTRKKTNKVSAVELGIENNIKPKYKQVEIKVDKVTAIQQQELDSLDYPEESTEKQKVPALKPKESKPKKRKTKKLVKKK